MSYRVTDSYSSVNTAARINSQRGTLQVLQERLATGKRINRPSDDPAGAELVLKLRTSQTEIEQFKRSATAANQKLIASDETLNNYELILDRLKVLTAQGLSDTTTQTSRDALATEIEALRERILNIANSKYNDEFLFGGTRQNEPSFDPSTAASSANPATAQYIQIEPGANAIAVGVTAESVFTDSTAGIFADLNAAAAALRGTGDEAADRATLDNTMLRLKNYSELSAVARTKIGTNMKVAEIAQERLSGDFQSIEERAGELENADFAETALQFSEAQRALEATLQVAASGRRSLFDFLG